MNQYGHMAMKHWRTYRPVQYATISDPDRFFTQLGEQIAQQIATLAADLEGTPSPEESFLERVGRLNMARLSAQEQVLRETLPPEPGDVPPP
jgi:hypothetical protein